MGLGLFESRKRDDDISHDIFARPLSLFLLDLSLECMHTQLDSSHWPGMGLNVCVHLSISTGSKEQCTRSQDGLELSFLPQPQTSKCPLWDLRPSKLISFIVNSALTQMSSCKVCFAAQVTPRTSSFQIQDIASQVCTDGPKKNQILYKISTGKVKNKF